MTDKTETAERKHAAEKKQTPAVVKVRKAVRLIVPLAIVVTLLAGFGSGTLCSVGYDAISYVCPLGALESMFGTLAFVPRTVIILAVVVVVTLLVGKAFCSWICPVPPISDLFTGKKRRHADHAERIEAAKRAGERWHECSGCGACGSCGGADTADGVRPAAAEGKPALVGKDLAKQTGRKKVRLDGRHVVLAGALGSSLLCGFPVFCLVCPVGLTFATAIALYRLAGFNEPTLEIIVFPALLILELTVLRKWCHRFCPIGALLSLIGSLTKATRPKVDPARCVRSDGKECTVCAAACPEHIDPCSNLGDRPFSECTRCGKCVEACPHDALGFLKAGGVRTQKAVEAEVR